MRRPTSPQKVTEKQVMGAAEAPVKRGGNKAKNTMTWTEKCRLVRWSQVSAVTRSGTAGPSGFRTQKHTNCSDPSCRHSGLQVLKDASSMKRHRILSCTWQFFFVTMDQMLVCNVKDVMHVESYHPSLHFVSTFIGLFLSLIYWFKASLLRLTVCAMTD